MDYKTKVTVTSALLGVLSLTAVLGWVFSQQAVSQRQAQEPLLAGFQPAAVAKMELAGGVALTKDTAWHLTAAGQAFPASSDRIDNYLKSLAALQRERLVTTGDDVKAFGLAEGFKTVKLTGADGKVTELQVGSPNDLGNKVFVRLAVQKEVWETDRSFARTLDQDFNAWADLTMFPGKKAGDLTRLSFDSKIEASDKTQYTPFDLVKTTAGGKTKWENRLTKSTTESMAAWTDLVPVFHFGAFVGASDGPSTGAALGMLTATWADGSQTVVKIGPSDAKNRYRAVSGDHEFWINEWALGQLLYK